MKFTSALFAFLASVAVSTPQGIAMKDSNIIQNNYTFNALQYINFNKDPGLYDLWKQLQMCIEKDLIIQKATQPEGQEVSYNIQLYILEQARKEVADDFNKLHQEICLRQNYLTAQIKFDRETLEWQRNYIWTLRSSYISVSEVIQKLNVFISKMDPGNLDNFKEYLQANNIYQFKEELYRKWAECINIITTTYPKMQLENSLSNLFKIGVPNISGKEYSLVVDDFVNFLNKGNNMLTLKSAAREAQIEKQEQEKELSAQLICCSQYFDEKNNPFAFHLTQHCLFPDGVISGACTGLSFLKALCHEISLRFPGKEDKITGDDFFGDCYEMISSGKWLEQKKDNQQALILEIFYQQVVSFQAKHFLQGCQAYIACQDGPKIIQGYTEPAIQMGPFKGNFEEYLKEMVEKIAESFKTSHSVYVENVCHALTVQKYMDGNKKEQWRVFRPNDRFGNFFEEKIPEEIAKGILFEFVPTTGELEQVTLWPLKFALVDEPKEQP